MAAADWAALPPEVLAHVFAGLPAAVLARVVPRVCLAWRAAARSVLARAVCAGASHTRTGSRLAAAAADDALLAAVAGPRLRALDLAGCIHVTAVRRGRRGGRAFREGAVAGALGFAIPQTALFAGS
jgi:hypothetical protein